MTTRIVRAVLESLPLPPDVVTHVLLPLLHHCNPDRAKDRLFRACHSFQVPPRVLQRELQREAGLARPLFVSKLPAARLAATAWTAQHAAVFSAVAVRVLLDTFTCAFAPGVRLLFEVVLEAPRRWRGLLGGGGIPRVDTKALATAVAAAAAIDHRQLPPLVIGLRGVRSDPTAFVLVRPVLALK